MSDRNPPFSLYSSKYRAHFAKPAINKQHSMSNNLPDDPSSHKSELPPDVSRSIGGGMITLLWVLVLGGATLIAQQWLDNRQQARAPSWSDDVNGRPSLSLQSDRYGQYQLTGSANGEDVNFLLDTGASEISIPGDVAERLNLQRGRGYPVTTANGTITVYATQLEEITIGPFRLEDITAHINPSMEGDVALLGMSFLRHLELLQRAGTLTISTP